MTLIQIKLINAYAILVMAGRKMIGDVPDVLKESVELGIAEIEIEKLS